MTDHKAPSPEAKPNFSAMTRPLDECVRDTGARTFTGIPSFMVLRDYALKEGAYDIPKELKPFAEIHLLFKRVAHFYGALLSATHPNKAVTVDEAGNPIFSISNTIPFKDEFDNYGNPPLDKIKLYFWSTQEAKNANLQAQEVVLENVWVDKNMTLAQTLLSLGKASDGINTRDSANRRLIIGNVGQGTGIAKMLEKMYEHLSSALKHEAGVAPEEAKRMINKAGLDLPKEVVERVVREANAARR